jgi:hypothetical protein
MSYRRGRGGGSTPCRIIGTILGEAGTAPKNGKIFQKRDWLRRVRILLGRTCSALADGVMFFSSMASPSDSSLSMAMTGLSPLASFIRSAVASLSAAMSIGGPCMAFSQPTFQKKTNFLPDQLSKIVGGSFGHHSSPWNPRALSCFAGLQNAPPRTLQCPQTRPSSPSRSRFSIVSFFWNELDIFCRSWVEILHLHDNLHDPRRIHGGAKFLRWARGAPALAAPSDQASGLARAWDARALGLTSWAWLQGPLHRHLGH